MEDYLLAGIKNHIHDLRDFKAMRLKKVEPGYAKVQVKAHEGMANCYQNLHGGSLMVLADMVASTAAFACGKHVITLQSSTNFVHGIPADDQLITIEARVIHNGSRTMVVETQILDEAGTLCVINSSTMFVPKMVEESDPIPEPPLACVECWDPEDD